MVFPIAEPDLFFTFWRTESGFEFLSEVRIPIRICDHWSTDHPPALTFSSLRDSIVSFEIPPWLRIQDFYCNADPISAFQNNVYHYECNPGVFTKDNKAFPEEKKLLDSH
jgi:hypothetical protein